MVFKIILHRNLNQPAVSLHLKQGWIYQEAFYAQCFLGHVFICKAVCVCIKQKFHYHSDTGHTGLRRLCEDKTTDVEKHHRYYEDKTRGVSEAPESVLFSSRGERSPKLLGGCHGFPAFPWEQTKGEISLILGEKQGFLHSCDSDVRLLS